VYRKTAQVYDAIYGSMGKDYGEEAARLRELIGRYQESSGKRLLDVACGTGGHLVHLKDHFDVRGLDISAPMLRLAREKLPKVPFVKGSMTRFRFEHRFDVLLCLFSSIGYACTYGRLAKTFRNFYRHLVPGGITIAEAWIAPEDFHDGSLFGTFVDNTELKAARITVGRKKRRRSIIRFHYLLGTVDGIRHFTEIHRMGLFSREEYRKAMEEAGFAWRFEPGGLAGRGLHIGIKPHTASPQDRAHRNQGIRGRAD
jgi:ubiquinone/menaquinone biosynthesis C-methylase UbiE